MYGRERMELIWLSMYDESAVWFPCLFHCEKAKFPLSAICQNFLFSSLLRNIPPGAKNFIPFHWIGLWLAVTAIPPAAFIFSTARATVGVGQMPIATTSHPIWRRVELTIWAMLAPVTRPSRPITIVPRLQYSAKAAVYFTITSGVKFSPTTPRIPEMLTINDMLKLPFKKL